MSLEEKLDELIEEKDDEVVEPVETEEDNQVEEPEEKEEGGDEPFDQAEFLKKLMNEGEEETKEEEKTEEAKVEDLAMTRDDALALAKARQFQQEQARARQQQEEQAKEMAAYKAKVDDFQVKANAVFASKAKDLDFNAKIEIMGKHFQKPGQVERFVREVPPEQWLSTLEYMYDSIQAPKPTPKPTPIAGVSHKRTGFRSRTDGSFDPEKSVASIMDSMGL